MVNQKIPKSSAPKSKKVGPKLKFFPCSCTICSKPFPPMAPLPPSRRATCSERCERSRACQSWPSEDAWLRGSKLKRKVPGEKRAKTGRSLNNLGRNKTPRKIWGEKNNTKNITCSTHAIILVRKKKDDTVIWDVHNWLQLEFLVPKLSEKSWHSQCLRTAPGPVGSPWCCGASDASPSSWYQGHPPGAPSKILHPL